MASAATESTRITKLLKETVVLLCENSLSFTSELHVQALLAITVDRSTIFAVQLDENLAKNVESAGGGVSSGSSGTQGRVASEPRPPAARRLALPAPPMSSPAVGSNDGLAWPLQSPPAARGARGRGPRFPVGRGRGTVRGRGGSTARGGATGVRMIRTAVSSVRFPVSRPRMQVPQRGVHPGRARFPPQQLALPPATGGSSPRGMPAAAFRQRAPVPPSGVQSQPMMRKPSPRLAIMAPAHSSSIGGTPPGPRQQMPSVMPRQVSPARAPGAPTGARRPRLAIMPPAQSAGSSAAPASLRQQLPSVVPRQASPLRVQAPGAPRGRPRLAIMPAPQQPLPAQSQGMVLGSPAQSRAMPHESSSKLALVPMSKSPSGVRPQAKTQIPPSPRQQAPTVLKQEASPRTLQLANQMSSPNVNTQVSALVAHLLKQHGQPSPAKQAPLPKPATSAAPRFPPPPLVSVSPGCPTTLQSTQSAAVAVTLAAVRNPMIVVNSGQAGQLQTPSSTAPVVLSPQTSRLIHNTVKLSNQSSQRPSAAIPTTVAMSQQRVVVTCAASKISAAVSKADSTSAVHAPVYHTFPKATAVPNTLANIIAQNFGMTGAQLLGMQSQGITNTLTTQPAAAANVNAYLLSPGTPFSPSRLQPAPSLAAVPLFTSPARSAAAAVPQSPAQRTYALGVEQHTLPKNVVVSGSVPGAGDSNGSLSGMQALVLKQQAGTPSKQMLYSPQACPAPYSPATAQQHVMFSPMQQQRLAPSSSSQYLSAVLVDDMSQASRQLSSPAGGCFAVGSLQQSSQNAAPASPWPSYLQQMSQRTMQQLPSPSQGQSSTAAMQQTRQNPQQVSSLQSPVPVAVQQYVPHPQDVSAAMQGQVASGHQPKLTANQQQVSTLVSASSVQQRSQATQPGLHQLIQYRQQTPASSPGRTCSTAMQHGQTMPAQQSQSPLISSQNTRPEAASGKPQNVQSASQNAVGSAESDRDAILEIIKRQAYDQVRKVKRELEGSAQQNVAGPASSNHQVAAASTPGKTMASVTTAQPVTTAVSHARIVLPPASNATVRRQSGQVASPAAQRPPQVPKHSMPQHTATSKLIESASPSIGRQAVPAPVIDSETFLTGIPSSASSSSCIGQVSSPVVQHQPCLSECMSSASGTSLMPVNLASAAVISRSRPSSPISISDDSISAVPSAIPQSEAASASTVTVQDSLVDSKDKLLLLKEQVEKKGSVERDRQQIISAQLSQLQAEIATDDETIVDEETVFDEETVVEDVEPSSPELPDTSASGGRTSVVRSSRSGR